MALKFRKNYYFIIISILICLLLGFLYLGNYNLIEGATNNDEKDEEATKKIAQTTGGVDKSSDGYNAQYEAYKLNKMLAQKNP
jgi:hypothetical protein